MGNCITLTLWQYLGLLAGFGIPLFTFIIWYDIGNM